MPFTVSRAPSQMTVMGSRKEGEPGWGYLMFHVRFSLGRNTVSAVKTAGRDLKISLVSRLLSFSMGGTSAPADLELSTRHNTRMYDMLKHFAALAQQHSALKSWNQLCQL